MEGNATNKEDCEDIQGISVPQDNEKVTDVTHFESDAIQCAEVVSTNMSTIRPEGDIDSLKTYLKRPFLFRTGTFQTAPGAQETLNIAAHNDLVSVLGQNNLDRMTGAKGFRATICFKLVVTATPFHQGIAALSFQYGLASSFNGRRGNFPYLCTNLPHVKIDLAEQTSVELRVPYIAAVEYFPVDVTAQDGFNVNFGTIALTRLTTFRLAASQVAARYSLYTWLEDVELIGAYPYDLATVNLQAGQAAESSADKLVSKGLSATAKIASGLTGIPYIGGAMRTTAWFARAAAGLASAFGYSRPVDETIIRRKAIIGYMGESHCDLPSSSVVASPFQTNALAVGVVGGNDIDEMSFNNILSKPAMIYRKVFAPTIATGDLLYASIVSPSCFWYRDNAGSGNIGYPANATLTTSCFAPSHLCYLGSNFRYWRGGFKFTFEFSKTKMHGGRIMISYTPGTSATLNGPITTIQDVPVASTTGVQMTGYSKMFDLRDSSVVEFEVPYINESPYTLYTGSIGTLAVQVISALNSPTSTSDNIDMLVYVEALPNFEFAGLAPSMLDATDFRSDNVTSGVYLQAGGVSHTPDASQYVVGEKFSSVKQLLMIPDWHVFDQANNTFLNFTLGPWFRKDYLPIITGTSPISNTASAVWYGSKCGRMQEMFSFVQGSTEWTAITDDPDGDANGITVSVVPNDGNATVVGPGSLYNRALVETSGHLVVEQRGAVRVRVPSFMKYQRIPHYPYRQGAGVSQTTAPGTYNVGLSFGSHLYNMRIRNNTGLTRRVALGRAAGDDASVGQYIGPPLCNLFQATAANSPNPSTLPF